MNFDKIWTVRSRISVVFKNIRDILYTTIHNFDDFGRNPKNFPNFTIFTFHNFYASGTTYNVHILEICFFVNWQPIYKRLRLRIGVGGGALKRIWPLKFSITLFKTMEEDFNALQPFFKLP